MRKTFFKKAVAPSALIFGIVAGIGVTAGAQSSLFKPVANAPYTPPAYNADTGEEVTYDTPNFPVNANGETYGIIGGLSLRCEDEPDLIGAGGIHGKIGYIRRSETGIDDGATTPEEATRLQEERIRSGVKTKIYPVYEADGVTIIDTFVAGEYDESLVKEYEKKWAKEAKAAK